MLYRARMSLRKSLEERWFLKEGTRAPDKTETPSRRPKSRSVAEPEML